MNENLMLDCSLKKPLHLQSFLQAQNANEAAFDREVPHPKACENIGLNDIEETKSIVLRWKQSPFLLSTFN